MNWEFNAELSRELLEMECSRIIEREVAGHDQLDLRDGCCDSGHGAQQGVEPLALIQTTEEQNGGPLRGWRAPTARTSTPLGMM
jgi:hypothetical protein